MKRIFLTGVLLIAFIQFAYTQTITISGTVKDKQGQPISSAFLRDIKYNYATFSDSVGSFSLALNPESKLIIKAKGFKEEVINIDHQTDFQITLNKAEGADLNNKGTEAPATATESTNQLSNAFTPNASVNSSSSYSFTEGTSFAARQKEDVHGSRYLFENWVHGFIINPGDSLYQNNNYKFNYDKIGGGLLLTQDETSVVEVNKDQVKSFTLFNNNSKPYVFEMETDINPTHFVQVLSSGKKYKIYKSISTKFVKANYTTNGFVAEGNNYDEYVDEITYYALDVQSNQLQKISPKKKSVKAVFVKDADKVNKFINDNSGDIDDTYLKSLGDALNN